MTRGYRLLFPAGEAIMGVEVDSAIRVSKGNRSAPTLMNAIAGVTTPNDVPE